MHNQTASGLKGAGRNSSTVMALPWKNTMPYGLRNAEPALCAVTSHRTEPALPWTIAILQGVFAPCCVTDAIRE